MITYNTIIDEVRNVPIDKLDELYHFVHKLAVKKTTKSKHKGGRTFEGIFNGMKQEDFNDFLSITKENRAELFERKFDI